MSERFYQVAVNTPFNNSLLTYASEVDFNKGDLVEVPLGKRFVTGCIVELVDSIDEKFKIKKIRSILDDSLSLGDEIDFYRWTANYYHYPLGQFVKDILPKLMKRPKELKAYSSPGKEIEVVLEEEQSNVWDILKNIELNKFSKKLIHGITGSGKSILYLEFIKKVFSKDKTVLFLVPEINLTPQFISFFTSHLNVPVYLYHSDISNSDRYNLWIKMINNDEKALIIGVRSSIFIPIKNLGCIVVDEEHDNSFKQDDRCPYNARDIAIKKAHMKNIPIILGSATPAMETYSNFQKNNDYLTLKTRYSTGAPPNIEMVDLRKSSYGTDFEKWPIPEETLERVKERLDLGEQVIFFVNKLGFASFVQCRSCGHTFDCPNCSVSLTMFKGRKELVCHSCTYVEPMPDLCPKCQNMQLLNKGFGTEKVKEVLEQHFIDKKIERFDRDEIKTSKKLEDVLNKFHDGTTDILVGTQMISKGHNFKRVNLVVVLGIDSQMNYPDYRSNERTFQLLTQISGRSGRFGKESSVLIHTHSPENQIFSYITSGSFDGFYKDEIEVRQLCSCPPFFKLAVVYFNGKNRDQLVSYSEKSTAVLKKLSSTHFKDVQIFGPRPSVIEKRANKFTWVVLLKSSEVNNLHNLLRTWKDGIPKQSQATIKIDIDPQFII
ncbi:MAG: primosomal protein N' (replication factor Y) [Bacteriovoracaceae bacterium]|jgi:primosomal protein N' (replication factor Y)